MLRAWSSGDTERDNEIFLAVYEELHRQAHRYLRRERQGHTLQTTALINEAYIKLRGQRGFQWESREHFFAICAQMMRRILADYARTRHRAKRGGHAVHLPLEEVVVAMEQGANIDLLELDDALTELERIDPQQARVVELKFFSGCNIDQTAAVLGVSASTVERDWRMAKAWLRKKLSA
jgi:RNA polymerase sigma factor (TIGR02999 family)